MSTVWRDNVAQVDVSPAACDFQQELPEELRANSVRPVKVHKMSSGKASGFSLDRADFAWQRWRGLRLVREG